MTIQKRYIVDEEGKPKEVVISLEDFRKMEELLGWDLDEEAGRQLKEARLDRETGNKGAYTDLNDL